MLQITSPATGELIQELIKDGANSVEQKFAAAVAAQKQWSQSPLENRMSVMRRFCDALTDHANELASTLTSETGKPINQSLGEIQATVPRIKYFIENCQKYYEGQVAFHDSNIEESLSWDPLGVIVNISAWNYPYFVGTNVFVPALLLGNAVMYKPSEYASLTGVKIREHLLNSGLDEDLFPLCIGDGKVGSLLLEKPVDGVFFTGSVATGRAIHKSAGGKLLPMGFELGGKDPCYVTDAIDVAAVAAAVADGAFYNCGQSCCAVERVYVHESVYEDFVEAFIATVKDFVVGDPFAERTYIGPLTLPHQCQMLQAQVEDAVNKGANLVLGGEPRSDLGKQFFAPTVLTEVNHSMTMMKEESFGPIIGIQKVSSDEEAVNLMNDTDYGLAASVFSQDLSRGKQILKQIDAGTCYLNCCDRVSPHVPWSGRKNSGLGSTLGDLGFQAFLKPKAWHIRGA
ncbi:MAG: aldehyde dehydrogenase family protein [Pseudobacteriovorax sp.]|nr:aldehyde dehydrogenase family protein [Pseudobacteriovorax sp.]